MNNDCFGLVEELFDSLPIDLYLKSHLLYRKRLIGVMDLPRQVIHRDPNPSNIILAKDKWGFIDFELSEIGRASCRERV